MKDSLKYSGLSSEEVFHLVMWMLDPKAIDGAVRSAIHAHGPITFQAEKLRIHAPRAYRVPRLTLSNLIRKWRGKELIYDTLVPVGANYDTIGTCGSSSASKRIRGALKTRVDEYFRDRERNSDTTVINNETVVK